MKKIKKPYDTLVLNKIWVPVNIVDYKVCMRYICQDAASPLDNDFLPYNFNDWLEYSTLPRVIDDGYAFINTINHKIAIPDIIVHHGYDRLPRREVKFTRQSVFERDEYKCQYCGKKFHRDNLQKEHVIPKSQGGQSNWDNIVTSCGACNARKRDRTPEQAGMKLLRKPSEPKWLGPFAKIKNRPNIRPAWKTFLGKVEG